MAVVRGMWTVEIANIGRGYKSRMPHFYFEDHFNSTLGESDVLYREYRILIFIYFGKTSFTETHIGKHKNRQVPDCFGIYASKRTDLLLLRAGEKRGVICVCDHKHI